MDLIDDRAGVFDDVLQETMLATYQKGAARACCQVHRLDFAAEERVNSTLIANVALPERPHEPWLIPRDSQQASLIARLTEMPHRLVDYGYKVSTGPLVWNRHKPQLYDRPGKGQFPLIWAEAVTADGRFEPKAEKRNHKPFFMPRDGDDWLLVKTPCILLQRTTSKEQSRRLITAILPREFLERHGAVVVENHLNMVRPVVASPAVSMVALHALLKSWVADQVFRCLNGSVAVSAYELEAMPLPSPGVMKDIDKLIRKGASEEFVESIIEEFYFNGIATAVA